MKKAEDLNNNILKLYNYMGKNKLHSIFSVILRILSLIFAMFIFFISGGSLITISTQELNVQDKFTFLWAFIFSLIWAISLFLITFYNPAKKYLKFNLRNNWAFLSLLVLHIFTFFIGLFIVIILTILVMKFV